MTVFEYLGRLPNLHKRVADAIQDGFIRRFDMRVNSRDGDQDLSMWMRDVEEAVREIMHDERFKGHKNFSFEASLEDNGKRVYGGQANAVVLSDWSNKVRSIVVVVYPRLSPGQVIPGYP